MAQRPKIVLNNPYRSGFRGGPTIFSAELTLRTFDRGQIGHHWQCVEEHSEALVAEFLFAVVKPAEAAAAQSHRSSRLDPQQTDRV
jgi:hypothetical protein